MKNYFKDCIDCPDRPSKCRCDKYWEAKKLHDQDKELIRKFKQMERDFTGLKVMTNQISTRSKHGCI